MKPSLWRRVIYWALIPAVVLLVANAIRVETISPKGPFGEGEARMVLLNNAINYTFAVGFQAFLALFLIVIAGVLWRASRLPRGAASSMVLPIALLSIYALAVVCAVLLNREKPEFGALVYIGLVIIALSWVALAAALLLLRRARSGAALPSVDSGRS